MTTAQPLSTDRARRLFQYLQEFTQLKYRPQRTSDNDSLIWLGNLPDEREIENAARFAGDPASAPEEWLVVRKPKLLPPPELPEELAAWVQGSLNDPQTPPVIRSQLVVNAQVTDDDLRTCTIQETLFLDQEPGIEQAWTKFNQAWQDWAVGENRARRVQKVYSQLFDFHQKLSSFGETYELRLGLGFLQWSTPGKYEVKRHLLTARAAIHFDAMRGILSVTAGGDGAQTRLEQDMLDPDDRVMPEVQAGLQAQLSSEGELIWGAGTLPALLETWVNAAADRGQYRAELKPAPTTTENPVVSWAPALVLRRRGERTLAAAYDDILGQVGGLNELPDSVQRYIDADYTPVAHQGDAAEKIIFFPKPANDKQREIIHRLERESGVLVQGPPGTGKSHTIVNLVSHLLATDQKVLVTSHTARALMVLRDKFPPELANLCVTHLRGEDGARVMLEGSVNELLQRSTNRRTPAEEEQEERTLYAALERARQDEQHQLDLLQDIRRAETDALNMYGYVGTAQAIGNELREQEARLGWLDELVQQVKGDAPLTDTEALRLLRLLRTLPAQTRDELQLRRPDLSALPLPEDFVRSLQAERDAQALTAQHTAIRSNPEYQLILSTQRATRERLTWTLQALTAASESARRRPQPWAGDAADTTLRGQGNRWQDVLEQSTTALPELLEQADWLQQTKLSGTEGRDLAVLRSDAEAVLSHLKSGGNWGNFLIKPAAVKTRLYLREIVKVDGRAADTPEVLEQLLRYLRLQDAAEQLQQTWAGIGVKPGGTLRQRLLELEEGRSVLQEMLSRLPALLKDAQDAVSAVPGLVEPRWWVPDNLNQLIQMAQAAEAESSALDHKRTLEALLPTLEGLTVVGNAHPVVKGLMVSVQNRDAEHYGRAYQHVAQLASQQVESDELHRLMGRLRGAAPELADEVLRTLDDPAWADRLGALEAAWKWSLADTRLYEISRPDAEQDARERLADARTRQNDTLGKLAAVKAWRSSLNRMTHKEQQALQRWQHAIKKLGKGTGKHAAHWRKVAQDALRDARTAIPAWIMPIHLVAENFQMEPGMFDVVIVDEASQAGPESIFLTWIAKRVIIVGDDKQIEPEGVGIQIDQVNALVNRYLFDFPARDIIGDVKASLFSYGSYTYPARLRLREHFRCMPEIIQFSSNLSYRDEPLMALRQFGADRLQPLVDRYVEGGYSIPKSGGNINPPEVRALVDQIKACIANPRYDRKTFGVISLVGDAQAEEIAMTLRAELPETVIEERKLVCGNAYSFQGDERDVMFLSMVDSPSAGQRHTLRSKDNATFQPRYNVAVSRARDQLWLFHSVQPEHLHPEDLRTALIQHVRHPEIPTLMPLSRPEIETLRTLAARLGRSRNTPPRPFDSWFELDVYLQLVGRGYRVIPQFEMNGYRIDLVVEGMRGRLAVECDGDYWHGPDQYRDDLARQQALERAGMEFWRVRGSTFAREPEGTLEELWLTLDRRGVFPEGDPRNHAPVVTDGVPPPIAPGAAPASSPETVEAQLRADDAARVDIEETTSDRVDSNMAETTRWDAITELDDSTTLTPAASRLDLEPYQSYLLQPGRSLLPDPRTASHDMLVNELTQIIGVEGPMLVQRAYQVYCQAAGVRLVQATKSQLNKALNQAIRSGQLTLEEGPRTAGLIDRIVRLPGTPNVRVRAIGIRKLAEVPPSEIAELLRHLVDRQPDTPVDREQLYRAVLAHYGIQRLTENARASLDRAYVMYEQPAPVIT